MFASITYFVPPGFSMAVTFSNTKWSLGYFAYDLLFNLSTALLIADWQVKLGCSWNPSLIVRQCYCSPPYLPYHLACFIFPVPNLYLYHFFWVKLVPFPLWDRWITGQDTLFNIWYCKCFYLWEFFLIEIHSM